MNAARRGLALLVASLIPLLIFGVMLRAEKQLNAGPRAAALVLATGPRAYEVGFSTDSGQQVVATLRTTRTYDVGDRLHVTYDRADPERVRWSREDTNNWRTPLLVAVALWLAAGGFFAVAIGRSPSARKVASAMLLVSGAAATAVGVGLLVWAANRPYADNQRNWAYLLGFAGLLGGALTALVGFIASKPLTRPLGQAARSAR